MTWLLDENAGKEGILPKKLAKHSDYKLFHIVNDDEF